MYHTILENPVTYIRIKSNRPLFAILTGDQERIFHKKTMKQTISRTVHPSVQELADLQQYFHHPYSLLNRASSAKSKLPHELSFPDLPCVRMYADGTMQHDLRPASYRKQHPAALDAAGDRS